MKFQKDRQEKKVDKLVSELKIPARCDFPQINTNLLQAYAVTKKKPLFFRHVRFSHKLY